MATIRFEKGELKHIFTAAFEHGNFPFVVESVRIRPESGEGTEGGYVEVYVKQKVGEIPFYKTEEVQR